jgi:phosphatidylglycerophosphatase C
MEEHRRALDTVESLLEAALSASEDAGAQVAVFDADHTLWDGDVGDEAFLAAAREGFLLEATWRGPLQAWAGRLGLALSADPAAGAAQLLDAASSGALERALGTGRWRQALYALQAWAYAGRRRDEVEAFGEALFARGFAARIYPAMQRVVEALAARGVEAMIASASHGALVTPGARRLGIRAAQVLGMEPDLDDAGVTQASLRRDTYGPAKAAAVSAALGGRRPRLAFGDAVLTTDRELLALAHQGVAVAARGAHREAALDHATLLLFDP